MEQVSIQTIGDTVWLVSPWAPETPRRARQIGGKWDAGRRAWRFDVRDLHRVEQLAYDIYGWSANAEDTVTVRVNAEDYADGDRVVLAGRIIARRHHRDDPVRLSDGVVLVKGTFAPSGGSISSPAIIGMSDYPEPVVEVRDVPRSVLEKLEPGSYELVGADPADELRKERARLMERVARIDARLKEMEE